MYPVGTPYTVRWRACSGASGFTTGITLSVLPLVSGHWGRAGATACASGAVWKL